MADTIEINYYSDMLCIWAYVGARRVDELAAKFGDQVQIKTRFCSVFSDVPAKIAANWASRGGYEGYGAHVRTVAERFDHISIHPDTWDRARPVSSAPAHVFLKAVEIVAAQDADIPFDQQKVTQAAAALREGFFSYGRDISDPKVLSDCATALGLDVDHLWQADVQMRAVAALTQDLDLARKENVEGSPTLLMNSGRQRLFGNVGYRLMEANVEELLRGAPKSAMSWC